MVYDCDYCNLRHEDSNWRTWVENKKVITVCSLYFKPSHPEHVPDSLKEDRKKNAKALIQPWREGEASAEFIEAYPHQAKHMFSLKERMKAKEVWKDDLPSGWRKTK
jgi:hypothetical protein